MAIIVMKFGGASVETPQHFSRVSELILNREHEGYQIVCVVSAMGKTTDNLCSLAKEVNPHPPKRELDMLISVGERISISLLAMSLLNCGREAVSFTGSQSGIITCSKHSEARIIDVRPKRVLSSLEQGKIVIVAGFQGVSSHGEITTLGRGGSDTTAVALGIALGAERVEFYKDVPGIFSKDPKLHFDSVRCTHLTYQEALPIVQSGAPVLHPRCVVLAEKNAIPLRVFSYKKDAGEHEGTLINDERLKRSDRPQFEEFTEFSEIYAK